MLSVDWPLPYKELEIISDHLTLSDLQPISEAVDR